MPVMLSPTSAEAVRDILRDAADRPGTRIVLRGGGSKSDIGAPDDAATVLDLAGLSGIVAYDPAELVLTAQAGTRLSEIASLVAARDQALAFDPFDHGPVFGRPSGAATIGGIVAAGVSGPNRLSGGAARDHLLGFRAVTGGGEAFVGGAKVVKNVTGYDLPKIATGSWGRLMALTEVTLKVLPRPRRRATLSIDGLSDIEAQAAMTLALRSQAEVSAAAHLPATANGGTARTLLRVQGFEPSVEARIVLLRTLLSRHGPILRLDGEPEAALWGEIRDVAPLGRDRTLWRIAVPARACSALAASLSGPDTAHLFDWGGGLVWMTGDIAPGRVRAAASAAGGHAMLVRATAAMRATVPALHPEAPGVAALSRRVRRAFDPACLFETVRFRDPADAD